MKASKSNSPPGHEPSRQARGPELVEGRRRALRQLLARLTQLQNMELKRDQLLMKIGEARAAAGRAYHLVDSRLPAAREAVNAQTFTCKLHRAKLRMARRREGRYLSRSNPCDRLPVKLWELYCRASYFVKGGSYFGVWRLAFGPPQAPWRQRMPP